MPFVPLIVGLGKLIVSSVAYEAVSEGVTYAKEHFADSKRSNEVPTQSHDKMGKENISVARSVTYKPKPPSSKRAKSGRKTVKSTQASSEAKNNSTSTKNNPRITNRVKDSNNPGFLGSLTQKVKAAAIEKGSEIISQRITGQANDVSHDPQYADFDNNAYTRPAEFFPLSDSPKYSPWSVLEEAVDIDKDGNVDAVVYTVGRKRFKSDKVLSPTITSVKDKARISSFYQTLISPLLKECGIKSLRSIVTLLSMLQNETFKDEVLASILYEEMYDR